MTAKSRALALQWRLRTGDIGYETKMLHQQPGLLMTSTFRPRCMLEAALTLIALERGEEAQPFLECGEYCARVILGELPIPELWRTNSERLLPCGPDLRAADRATVLVHLQLIRWVWHGRWESALTAEAGELLHQAKRGKLWLAMPTVVPHVWVAAGRPERAVEVYERTIKPAKRPVVPPVNNRYAAGQLNALYVVARHLAGEPGLAQWASDACQIWLKRVRQWQLLDDFHDYHKLLWAHLWSAHFGGPQDPHEVIRALRGF